METPDDKLCKTCKHWHNRQRDLGWTQHDGFCINPEVVRYSVEHGCRVAPTVIGSDKHIKFESWAPGHGAPQKTGALMCTHEDFGCRFHEEHGPEAWETEDEEDEDED